MRSDELEQVKLNVFTNQSEIIRLQSETITELLQLLCQHLTADEMDRLPCISKINQAAVLKREIEL